MSTRQRTGKVIYFNLVFDFSPLTAAVPGRHVPDMLHERHHGRPQGRRDDSPERHSQPRIHIRLRQRNALFSFMILNLSTFIYKHTWYCIITHIRNSMTENEDCL